AGALREAGAGELAHELIFTNGPGTSPLPVQGFQNAVTGSQDRGGVRPRRKEVPQRNIKDLCSFLALNRDPRAPLVKTTDNCRHSSAGRFLVRYQIQRIADI